MSGSRNYQRSRVDRHDDTADRIARAARASAARDVESGLRAWDEVRDEWGELRWARDRPSPEDRGGPARRRPSPFERAVRALLARYALHRGMRSTPARVARMIEAMSTSQRARLSAEVARRWARDPRSVLATRPVSYSTTIRSVRLDSI